MRYFILGFMMVPAVLVLIGVLSRLAPDVDKGSNYLWLLAGGGTAVISVVILLATKLKDL